MNDSLKKAVFVFGVGYLIFWLFKPKVRKSFEVGKTAVQEVDPKERTPIAEPTMSKSDAKANPTASKAFTALKAYISAYNAGEPQSALDELNVELGKELGMNVYRRRQDNKLAVKDLNDKDIIVNN
jgi:hypothetical protein